MGTSLQRWPGKRIACVAALAALGLSLAAVTPAIAQSTPNLDALAAEATDPTASLMSFQLNDWYTASLHDVGGTINQVVLRSAIPFDAFGRPNIFRLTVPVFTTTPSGRTGLGDVTVFDLAVWNASWGRWGVGVSGSLPTGRDGLSLDKWTAGPALGFVNSSSKQHNWGVFAQTFFSIAGDGDAPNVGLLNLQPIYSYQLGEGRSLALGNSALVYDIARARWSSLMLGLNYGEVVSWGGHKWRPNVEVDYDFRDTLGNPQWVVRAGIVLLLPK